MCASGAGELSGRRAPGFSLPEAPGVQRDPQDYRGKILIVDFMQVTCEHCVAFSAILEQARAKYGDKIAILSIVNPPSDAKGVADYITQHKVKSPILFDCGQVAYSYLKPTSATITIPQRSLGSTPATLSVIWSRRASSLAIAAGCSAISAAIREPFMTRA